LAALLHDTLVVGVNQTAAFNRGRHLYSEGRPSGWALAHISSCHMQRWCTRINHVVRLLLELIPVAQRTGEWLDGVPTVFSVPNATSQPISKDQCTNLTLLYRPTRCGTDVQLTDFRPHVGYTWVYSTRLSIIRCMFYSPVHVTCLPFFFR